MMITASLLLNLALIAMLLVVVTRQRSAKTTSRAVPDKNDAADAKGDTSQADLTALRSAHHSVLDSISEGVLGLDLGRHITFANRAALGMLGQTLEGVVGRHEHELLHPHRADGTHYPADECPLTWLDDGTGMYGIEDHFLRRDGSLINVQISAALLQVPDGKTNAIIMFRDLGEHKENRAALLKAFADLDVLNRRLETAYDKLLQSEKLASVGQLAAGMAHEINNPIGFVSSNLSSLENYVKSLLGLLDSYDTLERDNVIPAEKLSALTTQKQKIDYDYLRTDVPELLRESRDGIERVRKIVQDLREFSHEGAEAQWADTDLHQCIDLTLSMLARELADRYEISKQYGDIPHVYCLASEINQVLLGVFLNAAQAIEGQGHISVRTQRLGARVHVEIGDSGCGIPEEVLSRIFDPFFTTKPVGAGRGLGLSIAYGTVQRHGGDITVTSEAGKGTIVNLYLPIDPRPAANDYINAPAPPSGVTAKVAAHE
jgi:two-component system, NtrC family, sensor kinase